MFLKILYLLRDIANMPISILNSIVFYYVKLIRLVDFKNKSRFWEENLQKYIDESKSNKIFIGKDKSITFYCPNTITNYRAKTFYTKEPDTIEWLSSKGEKNKILYDIGANMGIYSIYYSKKHNARSYSFEPSFKNLDILTRNIKLNNLQKLVTVIPNAVTKKNQISDFFQLNFIPGFAGATFDDEFNKKRIKTVNRQEFKPIEYLTLGINLDMLIRNKIIKKPDLIKIDVDGNELEVLKGMTSFLKKSKNISILIEIDERLKTGKKVHSLFKKNKFKLSSYRNDNFIYSK